LCSPYKISSNIQDLINDSKASNLTQESDKFWILVHALKAFVESSGVLPLPGSLSDMTSTTEGYIALQKIFQNKANEDMMAITAHVKASLVKLNKPESFVTESEIKTFCKNCNFLRVVRYRTLEDERNPKTANGSLFASQLASLPEEASYNIVWYFMLRAADRFFTQHKRYPGDKDSSVANDVIALSQIVNSLLAELNLTSSSINEKYIKEIVRFGASELHPIASYVGGIASQEVIKIITHMYVPMNNTFIFNGLNSTSLTTQL